MTALRTQVLCLALALVVSGCNFDLHTIPSIEDCMEAGVGNCGSSGNGGTAGGGSGGVAGNIGGSSGIGGIGGIGGSSGIGGVGGFAGNVGGIGGGCAFGDFVCNDGACLPSTVRCDGNMDCPDNSDEDPATCNLTCTCPVLMSNPVVTLQTCCIDPSTCGAHQAGVGGCYDVFDPGPIDPSCPSESIFVPSLGVMFPANGCCRTDGRCGFDGSIAGVRCVAREEMPPGLGGPRNPISCGAIDKRRCFANNECPSGQLCGELDYATGEFYCAPSMGGGETGEQCFEPMTSGECDSGLCFPNTMECSAACNGAFDCNNINGEPACAAFLAGNGAQFNVCGTMCRSLNWCRADQTCGIAIDPSGDAIGMCAALTQPGVQLRRSGEPCGMDVECASSLCVQNPSFGMKMCSAVCEGPADCTGGGFPLTRQCVPIDQLGIGLFGDVFVCQ